jgi:hypothetical protein
MSSAAAAAAIAAGRGMRRSRSLHPGERTPSLERRTLLRRKGSTMRVTLPLAAIFAAAVVSASFGALVAASSDAEAASCRMINIGTPSKPRYVKDPCCSSGR